MGRKNRKVKHQDPLKTLVGLVEDLLKLCSALLPSTVNKLYEEHLLIHQLVEEIRLLELQEKEIQFTNREECFDEFVRWLRDNTVTSVDDVSIAQFHIGNWGLKAEKPIKEGELWMTIPQEIMMTSQTLQKSPLADLIQSDPITRHLPQVGLSLLVLEERLDTNSFWKPYLDILPSTYDTVLYFTPQEFEILKGSPCFEEGLKHYRHIARQYAYFWRLFKRTDFGKKEIHLTSKFTYDAYRWATSTVMTRQNAIPVSDGSPPLCALIPFWDMCNHCPGKLTTDFNLEKGALECYAFGDFDKGDQVFIFYGPRPNSEFFLHNAFIDTNNSHDKVNIKLGISKNDALSYKKQLLFQRINIQRTDVFHVNSNNKKICDRLLAFSRVFVMTEDELDEWLSFEESDIEKAISAPEIDNLNLNDRAAQFLRIRLQLILRTYSTTLEEDKAKLNDDVDLNSRERLAISLRISEKEILLKALDQFS